VANKGHGIAEERALPLPEQASEALLMGLRLREGIDLPALSRRFALPESALIDAGRFAFYARQGLCWRQGARIGVTEQGMPLLDALLGELVPAELVGA